MRTLNLEVSDSIYEIITQSREQNGLNDAIVAAALVAAAEFWKGVDDRGVSNEEAINRLLVPWLDGYLNPVQETINVMGGSPCIGTTRVPVWAAVSLYKQGITDSELLQNYPTLTQHHLNAAWQYYTRHSSEIDAEIEAQSSEERVG